MSLPRDRQQAARVAGSKQPGPDISRLAPHLRREWDKEANAHLGSLTIKPHSNRKVAWVSGLCRTEQPHRWQATVQSRTNGSNCPFDSGTAVCPCNDLAHNYPEVAAEWDWEANSPSRPDSLTAFSSRKVVWRCRRCGHKWLAAVFSRTREESSCPQCAAEAKSVKTRQPTISERAPYVLAEWDFEANAREGWHPERVRLMSHKKVHWHRPAECKLGLVHRWRAPPSHRILLGHGSPFLQASGKAVCACNSLAVQCPEAAALWDFHANKHLTPDTVVVQSNKVAFWIYPDGTRWQQKVCDVVKTVKRRKQALLAS